MALEVRKVKHPQGSFLNRLLFFLGPAVVFQTPPSEILESFKNVSIFRKKTALSFKRILSCRLATAGATNSAPPEYLFSTASPTHRLPVETGAKAELLLTKVYKLQVLVLA